MNDLSGSELLLYGGMAVMAAAVVMAMLCIVIFILTGRRLRRRLEQEYGKPWRQDVRERRGKENVSNNS